MGYRDLIEDKVTALNATISGLTQQIQDDKVSEELHRNAMDGLRNLVISGQRSISQADILKIGLNDILLSGLTS